MTDEELKAIEERANTGDNAVRVSYDMLHAQIGGPETDFSKERIEKILAWYPRLAAVLRADVPALIAEVRRLRSAEMSLDDLLATLKRLAKESLELPEEAHPAADKALVAYIEASVPESRRGEVRAAFDAIRRWYE